ncbi:MAG TPA: glycoside hydrolase family 20 zincin-like fold domain-containing protein [Terriglobia bacterium]|nr:glycoside hydrolase family 20 zincin-like fold domain-containing protein [Terriglobia bacterium]
MSLTDLLLVALCLPCLGHAETASPLYARGYTVLPVPQRVTLENRDCRFGSDWRLSVGPGIPADDVAVQSLRDELASRNRIALAGLSSRHAKGVLNLAVAPNSVAVPGSSDREKGALARQAYRLTISTDEINITGDTLTGLFYGVQTFVQLLKPQGGSLWLPEGEIEDWPDLELRVIYWDDAHHLEHPDVLKAALRQAAFYKINGFAIKLEGHFQYKAAAPIVEPYALTPAELQDLTTYALRYHVQLMPYLDGPAHVSFILKHPEYAGLREFPDSNYEFCATNPDTYKLLFGMYRDLLDATRGSKYFVLSTDEPYYVGLAKNSQCDEADRAHELGSVGRVLAEFVTRAAGYLHDRGRTVIFWGEYPLKPADIDSLPSYLVNGETYGPQFDPVFKAHGIRQMIYTSTEGEEPLFPNYYLLPPSRLLHPDREPERAGRVQEMVDLIKEGSVPHLSPLPPGHPSSPQGDLMGVFIAGWADAGLHPETFWLGYATAPAAAWNASGALPDELMNSFYRLFYGPEGGNMGRVYQLMSEQAEVWDDSWDRVPSSLRPPIWGDSDRIFHPPRPAHDQALPDLPVPSLPLLQLGHDWTTGNSRRLALAAKALAENDELLDLLRSNLERVEFNRYNLEVFLSLAQLYRQNLEMILDLGRINDLLESAAAAAARADAAGAVASMDQALDLAGQIRSERNLALQNAVTTWYKSWFPRASEANGRRYGDEVDSVKDHRPVRTVDMSYLVYRELHYPLGDWAEKVLATRNQYAKAHELPGLGGQR